MRIAYTFEQCWRRVPGGTGIAAVEVARELALRSDVEVIGVAGRHRHPPTDGFAPPIAVNALPIGGPLLFESWLRLRWPKVESVVDNADLVHSTTIIPPATSLPLVVTIHDLAFLRHPDFFTARGNRVFRRSLDIIRDKAAMVLCSSQATLEDCLTAGIDADRLRLVPLGVRSQTITDADRARVRATYDLPERFVLFVGTLEPRKNLSKLVEALREQPDLPPLVIAGADGWGDISVVASNNVKFLGHVEERYLGGLYAAASVMAYPSLWEGFGLPVLEAMAQGTPVVTSELISTEEVAGGAAVLVDPRNAESIRAGIRNALADRAQLSQRGLQRAARATWNNTAQLTAAAYDEVVAG